MDRTRRSLPWNHRWAGSSFKASSGARQLRRLEGRLGYKRIRCARKQRGRDNEQDCVGGVLELQQLELEIGVITNLTAKAKGRLDQLLGRSGARHLLAVWRMPGLSCTFVPVAHDAKPPGKGDRGLNGLDAY